MLFLVAGKLEFLPPGKDAMHRSMASKELVTKDTRQAEAFEAYHKKHSCDLVINSDEPQDCKEIKQKTEFTSCKDIIIIVLLAIVLAQFICILVFLNNRV
jgi:hypothetical protein